MSKYKVLRPVIIGTIKKPGEIVEVNDEYAKGNKRLELVREINASPAEEVDITKMSVKQLKKLAKEKEIDLGEATTQEEIIAVIFEAAKASPAEE